MAKYDALAGYLMACNVDQTVLKFGQIEDIIGGSLPSSARLHRPWWANRKDGNSPHAEAWQNAGWEGRDVSMEREEITFYRVGKGVLKPQSLSEDVSGLSIADAKAGLAKFYGVPAAAIEITIRG